MQRLRERAARNHRSLQGELMAIIEEAVQPQTLPRRVDEVLAEVRKLGLPFPATKPPRSYGRIVMADIATKVIDASALVAAIFAEAAAEDVAARVRGCELVAPAMLDFELVNVCISKMRRRSPTGDRSACAPTARRWAMTVETMDVDHTAVLALAQRTGLTGYDASYLHLARTLEVELVTLDRQLAEAAEKFQ